MTEEKKKLDPKKKTNFLVATLAVIIIILLMTNAASYVVDTSLEKRIEEMELKEGKQGLQGEKGDDGIGVKGDKGDCGDNGSISVGPRGLRGSGGSSGANGKDGVDCMPNQLSLVTLLGLNGTYSFNLGGCYHHYYHFNISVGVADPEDDNMHIVFYTRLSEADQWCEYVKYFGGDGNYNAERNYRYREYEGVLTLFWLVETWDGSDIGLNYYNFTLMSV